MTAVVEAFISTVEDETADPITSVWEHGMAASTACTSVAPDCSDIVQLASTDIHGFKFLQGTIVGHTSPATPLVSQCVSAITADNLSKTRSELEPSLTKLFEKTVLDADQRPKILDL